MDEWLERYARALGEAAGTDLPLTDAEMGLVLRLARDVAHRTDERKNAPVATYLAGRFAAERARAGIGSEDAAREALAVADAELPPGNE